MPAAPAEIPQGPEDGMAGLPYTSMAQVIAASREVRPRQPAMAMDVLHSLGNLTSGELTRSIEEQVYDPEFTEWLELSLSLRRALVNGDPVEASARQWEQLHYGHAVSGRDFVELHARLQARYPAPATVAVLLPETGGLSAAGRAIRDGIISAYLERPGASSVRFYNSGKEQTSAMAAYFQAINDGATQIIGPLRTESTRAIASLPVHDVPVLLLNDPDMDPAEYGIRGAMVSSLSLSQTEEAATTAHRLLAQGQTRAAVIASENPWGERIESAFVDAFTGAHGQVVTRARFNPATSDHSAVLTAMLKIDESNQRRRDLQARLGIPLDFEPIRRDDLDFIYLVADTSQGRELGPLFRFHDAGDIPVYAAGRVFDGRRQSETDQDLDGIVFPITPWQLRTDADGLPELESLRDGASGRLYALGRDAWNLLRWLPLLQKDSGLLYQGDVGSLSLHTDGQLARQPAWARFSAGRPVPYQWLDQP